MESRDQDGDPLGGADQSEALPPKTVVRLPAAVAAGGLDRQGVFEDSGSTLS